jgi:hypothetical protein
MGIEPSSELNPDHTEELMEMDRVVVGWAILNERSGVMAWEPP